jgi:hypothetical protein
MLERANPACWAGAQQPLDMQVYNMQGGQAIQRTSRYHDT